MCIIEKKPLNLFLRIIQKYFKIKNIKLNRIIRLYKVKQIIERPLENIFIVTSAQSKESTKTER